MPTIHPDAQAEFSAILRAHMVRYPRMEPQDFGKLAYQSEFGPEHLIRDRTGVLAMLEDELTLCTGAAIPPEPIGNGLCRFHLEGLAPDALPLLLELFCRTAAEHQGSAEGLAARITLLETLDVPGMEAWLSGWRTAGFPAVRHSQTFRDAYSPHYRLLREDYARFFPALLAVDRLVRRGGNAIVAIDGRCGSGKTTLAALLASLFPCNVFHMDDFYLPPDRRIPGWETTPCANMDLERLDREVLAPVLAGQPVDCRAYDCASGQYRPAVRVPFRPLTVIEGSYALHPSLRDRYALRIFLNCSPEEQARRLRAREGDYYPMFQRRWIPLEEGYLHTSRPQDCCQLVLNM